MAILKLSLSTNAIRIAIVCCSLVANSLASFANETVQIEFNESSFDDPRLKVAPPMGSRDSITANADGIEIRKYADYSGLLDTEPAGIKVLVPAKGDFSVELKVKCLRLESPKTGWGQGLLLRVHLSDPARTVYQIGYGVKSNSEQRILITQIESKATNKVVQHKVYKAKELDGSIAISRSGKVVTFRLISANATPLTQQFDTHDADVAEFEIMCNELPQGKALAQFQLASLEIRADSLPPYVNPEARKKWVSWFLISQVIATILTVGVLIYLRRDEQSSELVASSEE